MKYDALQLYFDFGVDLLKRRIYFGDIDKEDGNDFEFGSVAVAVRGIDKMLDMSNKPIEIHMNSYGGNVADMMALIDRIQEAPCQFKFFGRGAIMSAAVWVMAVCDERRVSRHTQIMLHHGYEEMEGSVADLQIANRELELEIDVGCEVLAKNSRMPKEFWRACLKRDLHIAPEEAVELGLVDGVIEYRKRGNFRRGIRGQSLSSPPPKARLKILVKRLMKRVGIDGKMGEIHIHMPQEEEEEFKEFDDSQAILDKLIPEVNHERRNNDPDT